MKKFVVLLVAIVATAAFVAPAFADHKIGGYFRTQFSSFDQSKTVDAKSTTGVWTRLRMKWTNTLNENVNVVWYGELDPNWGQGNGGDLGADGKNVETKNAYLDMKVPGTPFAAKVGIQGFGAQFSSVFVDNDMAGLKLSADFGGPKGVLMYSKWDEGSTTNWDDTDLYAAQLTNLGPVEAGLYYIDHNGTKGGEMDIITAGVKADVKISDAFGIDGFLLYQDKSSAAATKVATDEGSAIVFTARAKVSDMGNFRLIYYSEDDDATDDNTLFETAGFAFAGENLYIMLADVYNTGNGGGELAINDAGEAGYGLMALTYAGNFNFGDYYLKAGAGYFMALEDSRDNEAVASRQGDVVGYEVAAMVGRKVAEKVDVSVRAAYAGLGDFYDAGPGNKDPDDPYKVVLMVNVPY